MAERVHVLPEGASDAVLAAARQGLRGAPVVSPSRAGVRGGAVSSLLEGESPRKERIHGRRPRRTGRFAFILEDPQPDPTLDPTTREITAVASPCPAKSHLRTRVGPCPHRLKDEMRRRLQLGLTSVVIAVRRVQLELLLAHPPRTAEVRVPLSTIRISRLIHQLESPVGEFAGAYGVPERDLRPRVLLQLYRQTEGAQIDFERFIQEVIGKEAAQLADALHEFRAGYPPDSVDIQDVSQLVCRQLSEEEARHIFGRLHYLHRLPQGMSTIAGVHPASGAPLIAVVYGPSRWRQLRRAVRAAMSLPNSEVVDVARVYSFMEAPRYATSWVLARLLSTLRRSQRAERILSTVVDTSLGFRGSSYIASGWSQIAVAQARPYSYLNGEYLPIGEFKVRYGTGDPTLLRGRLGERFSQSEPSLQRHSLVFARSTKKSMRARVDPVYIRRYGTDDHPHPGE